MKLLFFLLCFSIVMTSKSQTKLELVEAVHSKNITLARLLITRENVNTTDVHASNLLLLATKNNDLEMISFLLSLGADVNQQNAIYDSAFLYTGVSGNVEIAKLYLAHGARFDLFNRYKGTALIPAAERGHVEYVRLLASTPNYPINHVNKLGWTALMEAVILGDGTDKYVEIVGILIAAGADKTIPDRSGITALEHAENKQLEAIVALLSN